MANIDFNAKKGFISDMDGVIYHGEKLLPGAKEFVEWLQKENKQYLFLTNSSQKTPRDLSNKLKRLGMDVPEEHFYTSALATAAFVERQKPGCSVYVIGDTALVNALYEVGCVFDDQQPDFVIVGEVDAFTVEQLTKATNMVVNGSRLIGTNEDAYDPVENGIRPSCKAFISPISIATRVLPYFCGKPNPLMVRNGVKLLGCHVTESVFVGDRMDTDITAGVEAGLDTVLVLSGATTMEMLPRFAFYPTEIFDGVGTIPERAMKECNK